MLAALVTCVALDQCGWYLVSGSQDCTCVIWDISHLSSAPIKPVQTLYGHDQPITTVAIATELDMVASGSKVNTLLCALKSKLFVLRFLRSLVIGLKILCWTGRVFFRLSSSLSIFVTYLS